MSVQIFKVYQIQLDEKLVELVNKEGWNCHEKATAYADATFGNFKAAAMKFDECYTHVANIVADSLDHVFEVGNIGPEDRIERFGKMSSISVGNIIEDADGNRSVVANFGFETV
jgi:hypothetical protein